MENCQVWRMGDDGNEMPVRYATSITDTRCITSELESRNHKQVFWYTDVPPENYQNKQWIGYCFVVLWTKELYFDCPISASSRIPNPAGSSCGFFGFSLQRKGGTLGTMNRIATWELWGQENSSPRRAIRVAVHAPEPDPKSQHGDFRTLIEIDGVSKSRYGYGVNSMQSLVLAMQLLKIHVEQAIAVGWQFYFDETDDEPFDLLHSLSSHSPSSER